MDELDQLLTLLEKKNALEKEIAALIDRQADAGNIAEYAAAKIFDIDLRKQKNNKDDDGIFLSGPLAGHSVNVKYTAQRLPTLDLPKDWQQRQDTLAHYYLVLCGPKSTRQLLKDPHRPWVLESVFLFETLAILTVLAGKVQIGTATSVREEFWAAAELFPHAHNDLFPLSIEQRRLLMVVRERWTSV